MDTSKVTNMEDMFEGATAMTYPVPFLTYVIGKLGSNDLPIGTVPIPFDEIETVRKYFILRGKKMGRPMQVGDAGGGGDGWGGVPSGFCLQALKNGGDGSAHFNKNVNGDNNGLYFPVGKVPVSNFFLKVLQIKIKSRSLIIFFFLELTFFFLIYLLSSSFSLLFLRRQYPSQRRRRS